MQNKVINTQNDTEQFVRRKSLWATYTDNLIIIIIIIIIIIQVVRTHQHNTDSAVLETARCLKTEVQRETRNVKDSIAEKTKERWHGKRMHG
jgi:hypothetical protein